MKTSASEIKVVHSDLNVQLADGTKFKKFINLTREEKKKKLCGRLLAMPFTERTILIAVWPL